MGADFVIALKTAFAQICLTGISDHRLRWLTWAGYIQRFTAQRAARPSKQPFGSQLPPCWRVHIGNNQDSLEFTKFENLQAIQEPKVRKINTQLNTGANPLDIKQHF